MNSKFADISRRRPPSQYDSLQLRPSRSKSLDTESNTKLFKRNQNGSSTFTIPRHVHNDQLRSHEFSHESLKKKSHHGSLKSHHRTLSILDWYSVTASRFDISKSIDSSNQTLNSQHSYYFTNVPTADSLEELYQPEKRLSILPEMSMEASLVSPATKDFINSFVATNQIKEEAAVQHDTPSEKSQKIHSSSETVAFWKVMKKGNSRNNQRHSLDSIAVSKMVKSNDRLASATVSTKSLNTREQIIPTTRINRAISGKLVSISANSSMNNVRANQYPRAPLKSRSKSESVKTSLKRPDSQQSIKKSKTTLSGTSLMKLKKAMSGTKLNENSTMYYSLLNASKLKVNVSIADMRLWKRPGQFNMTELVKEAVKILDPSQQNRKPMASELKAHWKTLHTSLRFALQCGRAATRRIQEILKKVENLSAVEPTNAPKTLTDALKGMSSMQIDASSIQLKRLLRTPPEVRSHDMVTQIDQIMMERMPDYVKSFPDQQERLHICKWIRFDPLKKGSVLLWEEHFCTCFYFILSGQVEVFKINKGAKLKVLYLFRLLTVDSSL